MNLPMWVCIIGLVVCCLLGKPLLALICLALTWLLYSGPDDDGE